MEFLQIPLLLLHSMGFGFREKENFFLKLLAFFNTLSLLLILIPNWAYDFANYSNINLVSYSLQFHLTGLLSVVKSQCLFFKKKQFYAVVRELKEIIKSVSKDDEELLQEGYIIEKRLAVFDTGSTLSVGTLLMLGPIAQNIYSYYTDGTIVRQLTMPAILPFDYTPDPIYEIIYLWFVQATIAAMLISIGVDVLFYGCSFNCGAHLKIIQRNLMKIDLEFLDNRTNKVRVTEEFRALIQYHTKIFDITKKLNDIYFPVIFAQFLLSSLQLCVIAYQLTMNHSEIVTFAQNVSFLVAILFQVFIYCHGGSVLKSESEEVSNAFYFSRWVECTKNTRKAILIALHRSQTQIQIRAAYIEANLATFASIISATGSYITILQSLSD